MQQGTAETSSVERALVGSDRVLAVLAELAQHPTGIGLDQLARSLCSPKPTVHRALVSLRRAGFAASNGRGNYQLGDEFIRLAFANHEARPDHLRAQPILAELAARHGETAHYAVLDGRSIVYRAKVDPSASTVRLTSTIGGRHPAHSTAVGKLLLSYALPDDRAVADWVKAGPLIMRTPKTKATAPELAADLRKIRRRGYSTESQENEPGVSGLAVPLFLSSPTTPDGAISISALTYRTPLAALVADLDAIRAVVQRRGAALALAAGRSG